MKSLTERTLAEHRAALDAGEYSSAELTRAFLREIKQKEPTVGAFLTLDAEGALRAAEESDKRRKRGETRGGLDGIPYAIKDNFCTRGLRTTCASRMLEHFVPPYDATVVEKLRDAGCVLLGKLNLDEFAMGSSNELSALGVTRNPHDPAYVAGGSSGGSAAAVAACEVPFSIGSDTGGSVRQPAAFCGVVGLKPTYGVISRYGMVAMASSLDCVGVLARNADDTAAVLSALVGTDGRDMTVTAHPSADFEKSLSLPLKKVRVAVVRELIGDEEVSRGVIEATKAAVERLRACGAEIGEVSLPSPEQALASYCVLSAAEASSNMARFDGVRYGRRSENGEDLFSLYANSRAEGFGTEVKRRILFGSYMLSEKNRSLYYDRAVAVRENIRKSLLESLETYDLILTPTAPTAAFRRGDAFTPAQQRRADLCAVYASLAGLPAVSVPFGKNADGLPLAVQLTAAPLEEGLLLAAAKLLEM